MSVIYNSVCKQCKKKYSGRGKFFCSQKCQGKYIRGVPTWNKGKSGNDFKKHYKNPNSFIGMKGKKHTKESIDKNRIAHLGEKNPAWKGDNISIRSLHAWVKRHKPKPEYCECCRKRKPFDLANISQKYKRDINDYEWICRKCHMKKDGRSIKVLNNLRQYKINSNIP